MLGLVATNLVRRTGRTVLTALGIGVGVAVIVALLSLTQGLSRSAAGLVHLGGADLAVYQSGVSDPTTSVLPASLVGRLQAEPYVSQATPLLLVTDAIPAQPGAIVFGAQPQGFFARRLVFSAGAPTWGAQDIALGDGLATRMHARPGGMVTVHHRRLRVAGVYHSGIEFEDSGAVMSLTAAQGLAGRSGEETLIGINLAPRVSASTARRRLGRDFSGLQVIATAAEAARAGANTVLISNAITLFVIVALVIGAITVTNTMVMSIIERQGELALLSTVGWSSARVAGMVVGEGLLVSLLGGAIGLLLGVIGSAGLVKLLDVGAYVSPVVTAWGLGRGLLIGMAIGVLGGVYPAWRVTRMRPLRGLARA